MDVIESEGQLSYVKLKEMNVGDMVEYSPSRIVKNIKVQLVPILTTRYKLKGKYGTGILDVSNDKLKITDYGDNGNNKMTVVFAKL